MFTLYVILTATFDSDSDLAGATRLAKCARANFAMIEETDPRVFCGGILMVSIIWVACFSTSRIDLG